MIVLCDIDSTIADTRHRAHASPHADPLNTWLDYGMLCEDDQLIHGTVALLRLLKNFGCKIYYVTGRPQIIHEQTLAWLFKHELPYDRLQTYNPNTDPEDHVEYKRSCLRTVQENDGSVILAIDDWPAVVDMYEEEGVPCICINPRYSDDPMKFFIERGYVLKE